MAVYKIYMATNNHMKKVMFQGDSITDANRNRSDNHFMALLQANVPQMVDKYISLQDFFLTHTTEDMVYLRDGVHPSENGQKVLAENVINALKELNK